MTPQEQAMADILHVSLVKWAETMHKALDLKRQMHPDKIEEANEQSRMVEKLVDNLMEHHRGQGHDAIMKLVDDLHKQITEIND